MKIHAIHIKNMFGIPDRFIDLGGSSMMITGANGVGKTSILKAVTVAFLGGSEDVIRAGYDVASVAVRTDEWLIERIIPRNAKPTVRVTLPSGKEVKAPAGMLKKVAAKLTFDPVKFISANPREQRDTLLRMVGSHPSVGTFQTWVDEAFNGKTPASVRERVSNALIGETHVNVIDLCKALYDVVYEERATISKSRAASEIIVSVLDGLKLPTLEDASDDALEIAAVFSEAINKQRHEAANAALAATMQLDVLQRACEAFQDTVPNRYAAEVSLPFADMQLVDGEIVVKQIPASVMSSAEQIMLCTAVLDRILATAELKTILLDGAERLDESNAKILREFARQRDLQLIETIVTQGALLPTVDRRAEAV